MRNNVDRMSGSVMRDHVAMAKYGLIVAGRTGSSRLPDRQGQRRLVSIMTKKANLHEWERCGERIESHTLCHTQHIAQP